MKLHIKEIAWGIDRKNGGYRERVTANESFVCEVGALPEIGVGRRNFTIDEVGADYVVFSVHYENNTSADKSWTLNKGAETSYMPRSFDGGHRYEFELK